MNPNLTGTATFLIPDDRVTCRPQCREFAPDASCRVARRRSRRDVHSQYGPGEPDLPRRCEFFRPHADAEDQTPGRKRFPELWEAYKRDFGHLHPNWPKADASTSKTLDAASKP